MSQYTGRDIVTDEIDEVKPQSEVSQWEQWIQGGEETWRFD
jgi:hypothetical protein